MQLRVPHQICIRIAELVFFFHAVFSSLQINLESKVAFAAQLETGIHSDVLVFEGQLFVDEVLQDHFSNLVNIAVDNHFSDVVDVHFDKSIREYLNYSFQRQVIELDKDTLLRCDSLFKLVTYLLNIEPEFDLSIYLD